MAALGSVNVAIKADAEEAEVDTHTWRRDVHAPIRATFWPDRYRRRALP